MMVLVNFDTEEKKKNYFMDNKLYDILTNQMRPKVKNKDFDQVIIIDGPEGSGKSAFAQQIANVLDDNFSIKNVCMNHEEFTKGILRAKKGSCIIFDEAFTGLSSRGALTPVNKLLVSLMMEMRQKNLFVIVVLPTFFELDRYVALFRTVGLFHIYMKGGQRGYWMAFDKLAKKKLYLKGKKFYDYSWPKANFIGRFPDCYTVPRDLYVEKKKKALQKRSFTVRAQKYLHQRDILLYIMHHTYKITQLEIASQCKKMGFKIDNSTIGQILKAFDSSKIDRGENENSQLNPDYFTPETNPLVENGT